MRFRFLIFTMMLAASVAQADVNSIVQTSNGTIWVGCSNGLFQITQERSVRITQGVFQSLAVDGDRVWAGTNKGLFHCEKQHCQHDSRMQEANVRIVAINGQRLYASTGAQVFEFLERKGIPLDVPPSSIQSIAVDASGSVWIATRESVGKFHDGIYEKMLNDSAQALAVDPNGNIWIGSGFLVYHAAQGKMTSVKLSAPASNVRTMPPIRALLPANDGTLWVGTRTGLLHWNGKRFEKTLSDVEITSLFEDSSSVLWIGTTRGLTKSVNGKLTEVPLSTGPEN